jgi:hypothetical protein
MRWFAKRTQLIMFCCLGLIGCRETTLTQNGSGTYRVAIPDATSPLVAFQTTSQWEVNGSVHDPNEPATPLWNYNGYTYFVWLDSSGHPYVDKRKNGVLIEQSLVGPANYVADFDAHGRFSIGIDLHGYIHVIGDMHNYTGAATGSVIENKQIRYWRSNQPESVAKGFTFAGDFGSTTSLDGSGWIAACAHFFSDRHGELYYTSSVHAMESAQSGKVGVGLYKYNVQLGTWTNLGGLPDNIVPSVARHAVLLWENGGFGGASNWFQNLQPMFKFDRNNLLHFVVTINTSANYLNGANRVIYARSADGGRTWTWANGKVIPGLPIRAADGTANLGDVVATTATIDVPGGQDYSKYFGALTSISLDRTGVVSVGTTDSYHLGSTSSYTFVLRNWDGLAWSKNKIQVSGGFNTSYYTPDGNQIYLSNSTSTISEAAGYTSSINVSSFNLPSTSGYNVFDLDEFALRNTGVIYSIGYNRTLNKQIILKTTLTPDPCKSANGIGCTQE